MVEAYLNGNQKVDTIKYGDNLTTISIDLYDGGQTVVIKDYKDYKVDFTYDTNTGSKTAPVSALCHPNKITLEVPKELYKELRMPHAGSTKPVIITLSFKVNGKSINDLKLNVLKSSQSLTDVDEDDNINSNREINPAIDTPKGDKKRVYDSVDSLFEQTGYDN